MNIVAQSNTVRILRNVALAFVLIVGTGGAFPIPAHAQFSGDGGCCGDTGWSTYGEGYSPSVVSSDTGWSTYGDGYTPMPASTDTGWYTYGEGYNPTTSDTGWYTYGEGYNPTYATDMYSTPGYSTVYNSPSYGYGGYYDYGYSVPSYGVGYSLGYSYTAPYTVHSYNPGPTVVTTPPSNSLTLTYSPYTITDSGNTTITDSGNTTNSGNSTNTSTYTSTYTSTTNIDSHNDSHNVVNVDSHNVTTVSQATPQYVAQAYLPSYPSYYPYYNYTYSYPYTYAATPSCTISARQGANGQTVLTWYSTNATSAYISPAVGSVALSGSTTIYPYGNSLYTLTVSGSGGTATCQTSVTPATVAYTAPATTAPYVALTQIPYTGFDYGPVGNAIYWLGLLSFAVAGAYLVVYYRGGAVAFATTMIRRERTPRAVKRASTIADVIAPVAHAEHSNDAKPAHQEIAAYVGVRDVMTLVPSKNGIAPRIVISRC